MFDILINKEKIECPCCGTIHNIEIRKRDTFAKINGSQVGYIEEYCFCDIEKNIFFPGEMADNNLKKAREAYNRINNCV